MYEMFQVDVVTVSRYIRRIVESELSVVGLAVCESFLKTGDLTKCISTLNLP